MEAPMPRKIIFFSMAGPDNDDSAWMPFSFARHAVEGDLECEVFLAGPASGLMRKQVRDTMAARPLESFTITREAKVPISVSPGCATRRGVTSSDLEEVGATPRQMSDMLREVAMGAQLVVLPG